MGQFLIAIEEDGFMESIVYDEFWDLRELHWSKVAGSVAVDGVFLKTETQIDGDVYYLKLSRYDSYRGIYGHESVNELIASRLGQLLGFNVPHGTLRKCMVLVDGVEREGYVYVAKSYKTAGSRQAFDDFYFHNRQAEDESPLDCCKRFGWADYIYKMFIFDYLIINRDRHGANMEVMKNGDKELSPYFDNGLSFLCFCENDDDAASFNIMEDRLVNNFIGEKRLALNLDAIDKRLTFNELKESDRELLFAGLRDVLSGKFLEMIWSIIWERWQYVKKFRIT